LDAQAKKGPQCGSSDFNPGPNVTAPHNLVVCRCRIEASKQSKPRWESVGTLSFRHVKTDGESIMSFAPARQTWRGCETLRVPNIMNSPNTPVSLVIFGSLLYAAVFLTFYLLNKNYWLLIDDG